MNKKIRLIYQPFLIITITFAIVYTFLHWLFFIQMQAFNIKEDVLKIWLPFILPWIPVLIWLRPRIKLLSLKQKKGDLVFLYMFVAALAIAAPAIVAQHYLESATGKLTALDNIHQVNKKPFTKYYTLKKHFSAKQFAAVYNMTNTSGKNNERLEEYIYIVVPVLENAADTLNEGYPGWIGYKYHEQISNRLSDAEKDEKFQAFANASQEDFDAMDFDDFVYLERMGNTNDRDYYFKALKQKGITTRNIIIFSGVNKPFAERNGNKLPWTFGAFAIGALVWLIMVLIPKINEETMQKFESGNISGEKDIKEFFAFFVPREGFYITPIIMDINIGVFILMVFSGLGFLSFNVHDLLDWGANYKPYTVNGQWWRLVTSTFLHAGIMHLFANMVGLLFVGIVLEPALGKNKYAFCYIVTGILASFASLLSHEATVSVGASGAIFGLFGIFLSLLLKKVFSKEMNKAFLTSTLIFIGYNLLMGLANTGIDNAAHIGGLVSGFVIGISIAPALKRKKENQ